MKKYIAMIICVALLITAVATGINPEVNNIAGRGYGNDSKITTVEEFTDVLEFFNNYEIKPVSEISTQSEINGFSAENSDDDIKEKYTSATFYNKSKLTQDSSYDDGKNSSSSRTTFIRELTINLTQTAAFYHSVGNVLQSSRSSTFGGEKESRSNILDFDCYFYITSKFCYIKFLKFNVTSSDDSMDEDYITQDMLDMWFDAGEEADELLALNEENYSILSSLGEYFEEFKISKFNQREKVYTLKSEYIKEVFSILFDLNYPDDMRGNFKLDLTNKTEPKVTLIQSYNTSNKNINVSINASANAYVENNIIFSYINNTIINNKSIPLNPPKLEEYAKGKVGL